MAKIIFPGAAALVVATAISGCRTTEEVLRDYERDISAGNYAAAVSEVASLAEKGDDSRQLWHLLAGAASHMAGDSTGSIRQFDAAEEVFGQNDTRSVFAQAGTGALAMMTNDRAFPYDGGGQDRIFTCIYRAIDFLGDGRFDLARVEFRRAGQYQDNWVYDRKRDIASAAERMEKDAAEYQRQQGQANATSSADRSALTKKVMSNGDFASQVRLNCGFDPLRDGDPSRVAARDYKNAYAMHLAGVTRWLEGDSDLNFMREAAELASRNPFVMRDFAEFRSGGRPKDQVWVWVEDGLCPKREEWRIDLPLVLLPYANKFIMYAGMAFPRFVPRTAAAGGWSVSAGGERTQLADLADVDGLVKTEYDVYMRGALAREITRTIVKIGMQVALGVAAEAALARYEKKKDRDKNKSLPIDYFSLKAAQVGVATWAATTTAADLRSWTALPKSVKVARIDRPADGKVVLLADGAPAVEIQVTDGNTLVFVRKPAAAAPCSVKVVPMR